MNFYTAFPFKFLEIKELNKNSYWYGWPCWMCCGDSTHSVLYGYLATPNQDGSHYPVCDECAKLTKALNDKQKDPHKENKVLAKAPENKP
jgi:ribosome-binding protein aMBF1 (putative translation factor)